MGLLRLQQGRLPKRAASDGSRRLKAQPGAPDTLANYAIALSALGRHEEALAALDSGGCGAPRRQPGPSAIAAPSKASWAAREAALGISTGPLALDSRNIDALNNRGLMLHQLAPLRRSAGQLSMPLMALAPDYAEAATIAALPCATWAATTKRWPNSTGCSPPSRAMPGAWVNRASALWRLDRVDEALASYDKALALEPDLLPALESRANLLWTRKQALAPAIADLEQALRLAPDRPYAAGRSAASENACRRLARF